MHLRIFLFLLFWATHICGTNAARILAIIPIKAKSHFYFHEVLLSSLASAGHKVTLITPYSLRKEVENFTIIKPPDDEFENPLADVAVKDLDLASIFSHMVNILMGDCQRVLKMPYIQNLLNSREKVVDVLFIELLFMYKCYLPIAEKLGIPVIGTFSGYSIADVDNAVGNPRNPAVIPFEIALLGRKMSFFERIRNVIFYSSFGFIDTFQVEPRIDTFLAKHHPDFDKNVKKVSLVLMNSHPLLSPRPVAPNYVHIGGIHLEMQAKQYVSKVLQKFIDDAKHGVILFSLGSIVSGNAFTPEFRQALKEVFSEIPQRVIWKFDEDIPGLSDNVLVSKWLPQRKILAHPNVVAFISHCGLMSTYEAIYSGKPMIMAPVFAEQPAIATRLQELEVGLVMDIRSSNKKKILELVHEIVHNPKYRDNMQNLSKAIRHNPMEASEAVIYWTNYVLRQGGAPYLRTSAVDMPLYQYLLLDIIFFITAIATAIFFFGIHLCKIVFQLFKLVRRLNIIKADKKTK